jgi:hypothetical protein
MDSSERPLPDREDAAGLPRQGTDSRRRFLARAGLGGLAITIGSVLVPFDELLTPASGQTTTTAANPDATVAAYAESVELALAQAYQVAMSSKLLVTPSFSAAVTGFASHHGDHAQAFAVLAGTAATSKANPKLLDVVTGQLHAAASENALLQVAYDIENAATSTHLYFLSSLKDTATVKLAASVLPVESQHATVVGLLLGKDPKSVADFLPSFVTQDAALLPKTYPTPAA